MTAILCVGILERRLWPSAAALGCTLLAPLASQAETTVGADGLVKVRSACSVDETVTRLKADIAAKGIRFFLAVDQAQLAGEAGIALRPSTLLVFGNPPLGVQFLTSNPYSGLDWPVRLLVLQDENGAVWTTFATLNSVVIAAPSTLRLGFADVSAPLGMVTLVFTAAISGLFIVYIGCARPAPTTPCHAVAE